MNALKLREMRVRNAASVRVIFAKTVIIIKYMIDAIIARCIFVATVTRNIIGFVVIVAISASVTSATRKKARKQYKSATVATRAAAVVIVGFLFCAKFTGKLRIALDVSN
mmetsp:Transcript_29656/g.59610  ORF Transcript_29656/g.59610 Transcript_29656/m.59610 type:complete len:110 (+) Transcript_29656:685-1014(+)